MGLDWGGYKNGKIPAGALAVCDNYKPLPGEPVGPNGNRMKAEAARQWNLLVFYAALAGHVITLSEGYREYDDQVKRYKTYQEKGKPLASYPGYSVHGWGLSADSDTTPAGRQWMRSNARAFGFDNTGDRFSSPEPWHYDYTLKPTITEKPKEGDIERTSTLVIFSAKGRGQLFSNYGQPIRLGTPAEVTALLKANIPVVEIEPSLYDRLNARAWG